MHSLTMRALGVGLLVSAMSAAALAACGGSGGDTPGYGSDGGGGDGGGGGDTGPGFTGKHDLLSITVEPPQASIESLNGAKPTQAFKAVGHFADATTVVLGSGVTWNVTAFPVGTIDGLGLYTASGAQGGVVKVTATSNALSGTAQLTVKLHLQDNVGNIGPAAQAALLAASNPDPTVVWAYPYDGTVFPRGLGAPPLMWNGGGATDAYYVHLTSPVFELESFSSAPPPSSYVFDPTKWAAFVGSTVGAADLKVARFANNVATVVAHHTWTIAPASLRGTVYYWANNLGRVERIKPGASAPDDFSATSLPTWSCTMTCHTVSADGSTMVSGGDGFGGTYNLLTNAPGYDVGGTPGSPQKRSWAMPALSPNGKYVVENASPLPGPPGGSDGLWSSADGTRVANSGLDGVQLGMPAFAPDGTSLAYVNIGGANAGALSIFAFNLALAKASSPTMLIPPGADPAKATIGFPSVTPDANWIVYHRGNTLDTRSGLCDLYLANAKTAGQEARLAKLDGDGYPFAAGARDLSYNYEPTFNPVASGGYFWVVFTSRRTYGNALTGLPSATKQLWVAAIDQSPTASKDPSHPAFRLPGQAIDSINMRGYWALDPCKGDGQGCASGTECCGGYCDGSSGDGGLVCKSAQTTCSQNGDHCTQTSDCCNAASGVTCINHVCSEPTPK